MNTNKVEELLTKIGGLVLFSGLIFLGVGESAQALTTGISSFSEGSTSSSGSTRGFRFRATEDLNVTALGVYDVGGGGLILELGRTGVDVGLWNDTGTLLGRVSVAGGTNAPILDGFRYERLATSVNLTSGEFYRVGADLSDIFGIDYIRNAVPETVNGIDSIQKAINTSVGSLNYPSSLGVSDQAFLGGNILFEDAASTSVPFEFSPTLGLLVVGGLFGGNKVYRRYCSSKVEIL